MVGVLWSVWRDGCGFAKASCEWFKGHNIYLEKQNISGSP